MNIKVKYIVMAVLLFIISGLTAAGCSKDNKAGSSGRKILYYTDAMHPSIKVSPEDYDNGTTQCPICNMDLFPVYADNKDSSKPPADKKKEMDIDMKKESGAGKKKILYYTDGMHPSIKVSPEEYDNGTTQCPICNMDLYPVYESDGNTETGSTVQMKTKPLKLSDREIELAGIRTFPADFYRLSKEIVTVGKVAYDPELVVAEKEYITAIESAEKMTASHIDETKKRAENLLDEVAYKLKLMGLNDRMIDDLRKTRKVHNNLILPEKTVWVYADIYEFELGLIDEGQEMTVEATAYPGEYFKGRIKAIDSVLNPKTRSVRIRAEIYNRGMKLKPDMYVKVIIYKNLGSKLSVPRDAVLDTGRRKLVYVDIGGGEYMQHEVETGYEAVTLIDNKKERMVNIIKGISKGDRVVVKANFLLDSQSQLSGPASAQYGGTLEGGGDEKDMPKGHRH